MYKMTPKYKMKVLYLLKSDENGMTDKENTLYIRK